jgi:tyrosinase
MQIFSLLVTASVALGATIKLRQDEQGCQNPALRVEWRNLSQEDQQAYLGAVVCLTQEPSRLGFENSWYDDFSWAHSMATSDAHNVAAFLPWHRRFLQIYEGALRECGYGGPSPYWDWTLDAENVSASPVWSSDFGFGGDGNSEQAEEGNGQRRECVSDGPFAGIRPVYWADTVEPHCLSRNFNDGGNNVGDMMAFAYGPDAINTLFGVQDYAGFRDQLERGPHGAVHTGIGGDMLMMTSPNDPIFFLHHAQVDRLWTIWQAQDLANREYGYAGPKNRGLGEDPEEATIDDVMTFYGLADDVVVRDMMSLNAPWLCYSYQ